MEMQKLLVFVVELFEKLNYKVEFIYNSKTNENCFLILDRYNFQVLKVEKIDNKIKITKI